jgi:hypothetical protein
LARDRFFALPAADFAFLAPALVVFFAGFLPVFRAADFGALLAFRAVRALLAWLLFFVAIAESLS